MSDVRILIAESHRICRIGMRTVLTNVPGWDGLTELLSPRELAVARLVASGHGNKEVAGLLGITVKTAETYRTRAMRKLGAHSVVDVVLEAVRLGLIDVDTRRLVAPEL